MKKWMLGFFTLSLMQSVMAFAAALPDENAAKALTTQIMEKVALSDLDSAFNMMKPYVVISEKEVDSVAAQSKTGRAKYSPRYGAAIGYEFIDSKKIGESILRLRYIEKASKHALPWIFYFYKSNEGWVLSAFDWNDDYKKVFFDGN